jgi:tRNA threonylcarbamoyl adenosine modification protein YjeE
MPAPSASHEFLETLANEQATARLACDLAALLQPGDVVTLSGDLGAGKTTFARALIRRLAGDPRLEVPSPTFTLVQSYPLAPFPILHADLYRVSDPEELAELGIEEAENAAILIEWPDRAGHALPADRLDLALTLAPQLGLNARQVRIAGHGAFAARAARLERLRRFLDKAGFGAADRQRLQGDASTRAYDRLILGERRAILMDAPRRPDGPPVRNGLPYSKVAHLAEDVQPFVAMANGLRQLGLSAPQIHAADLPAGLLVLEDFGTEGVVAGSPAAPVEERYGVAVDLLAALHRHDLPHSLPVAQDREHRLPTYDLDALMIEAELLVDWYFPFQEVELGSAERAGFVALWRAELARAVEAPRTWVLRDYHSPNILWLAERQGIARLGLLDFQDAVLGPHAYDLASLLQDARVDVPEPMEIALLGRYAKARRADLPDFDPGHFIETYALLGAQRATKILGIFARLHRRDGKSQYLGHMPRVWRYLQRNLSHPSLAALKGWYDYQVPAPS